MSQETVYLGRDGGPAGFELIASGKVRDIYAAGSDHLLFVTSDRVSAFDVVMDAGIPQKGAVLTSIAAHWFATTEHIVPNHLVHTDVDAIEGLDETWRERWRSRIMYVKRAKPDPVEWVVRGYIAGSGWKEYQKTQTVCGISLPAGLELAQQLPKPILTPTTKEEVHDRPLTPGEARDMVGAEHFEEAERVALALFEHGTETLKGLDIRLADTKFEFGMRDGKLLLIDEALTPDSSRFWANEDYRVGISPPSFDKQILRDHLETLDWNKEAPAPALDPAVLQKVSDKYLEVCERITGSKPVEVSS